MKRIKPEDLPEILTDDILKILAEMLAETPAASQRLLDGVDDISLPGGAT